MDVTLDQIAAVRADAGWFDRSTMGKLAVTGRDRYSWLQGMVSGDVRLLQNGQVSRLPACILDPTGHIIADLSLIDVPGGSYLAQELGFDGFILVETPPGAANDISAHLSRYLIMEDAEISDISTALSCVSAQGPSIHRLWPALEGLSGSTLMVEADHTGSGGVDLYAVAGRDEPYRQAVGSLVGIEIGVAAQDVLRIEAGIPKFGTDMDAATLAPEAGLVPSHASLTKGCYVGQEIVARIDSRGHTNRALTGLLALGETALAPGEKLFADELGDSGKEVGWLTSVASRAPAAGGRPIALGYVRHEHRTPGAWLRLGSAESRRRAQVAELPFYRRPGL